MSIYRNIEIHSHLLDKADDERIYTCEQWPNWRSKPCGLIRYNPKTNSGEGEIIDLQIKFKKRNNAVKVTYCISNFMEITQIETDKWVLKSNVHTLYFKCLDYRKDTAYAIINENDRHIVTLVTYPNITIFVKGILSLLSLGRIPPSRDYCLVPTTFPLNDNLEEILVVGLAVLRIVFCPLDFDDRVTP